MTKKQRTCKQKLSPKQIEARAQAATEKERRAAAVAAKKAHTKQIFTIAICVILVMALCIPTIGLSLLGSGA